MGDKLKDLNIKVVKEVLEGNNFNVKKSPYESFADKWMDVLYKESGAETTSSKTYKDGKLGNIRYSCKCKDKECGCE